MKKTFNILIAIISISVYSQNEIEWNENVQLQLSDFKSPQSQIENTSIKSLYASTGFDFLFSMSNVEFIFTKNFNSKVNNSFKPNSASIVAPNQETAIALLNFAQFQFNLSELCARKFRKKLNEEKKSFSNISFFKPIFDEFQKEFSEKTTLVGKETDLGQKKDKLKATNQQILNEIQALSNYCKTCKIPKKNK